MQDSKIGQWWEQKNQSTGRGNLFLDRVILIREIRNGTAIGISPGGASRAVPLHNLKRHLPDNF